MWRRSFALHARLRLAHDAGSASRARRAPPQDFGFGGFEKPTTGRERIVTELEKSFAHFRGAIQALPPDAAGQAVKMFGRGTKTRGAMSSVLEHLSEHLGQSIAYARSNDVVPPWTAAQGE